MVIRIVTTFLIGLFGWLSGAWLHKNRLFRFRERNKSHFPDFFEKVFNLENKYIDRGGLNYQFLAIWVWSIFLVIFDVVILEQWAAVAFPVGLFGMFVILVFTNWGWWRK